MVNALNLQIFVNLILERVSFDNRYSQQIIIDRLDEQTIIGLVDNSSNVSCPFSRQY